MKVAGVIVTYNRKELLFRNIDMQLAQTRRVDKLFIIDNHSTDGTEACVKEKYKEYRIGLNMFIYKKTQEELEDFIMELKLHMKRDTITFG